MVSELNRGGKKMKKEEKEVISPYLRVIISTFPSLFFFLFHLCLSSVIFLVLHYSSSCEFDRNLNVLLNISKNDKWGNSLLHVCTLCNVT